MISSTGKMNIGMESNMIKGKTIELLEKIQRNKVNRDTTSYIQIMQDYIAEADKYCERQLNGCGSIQQYIDKLKKINIPSKYQNPLHYLDIYEIFEFIQDTINEFDVEPFMSKFKYMKDGIPLFGTVPMKKFTAMIMSNSKDTDEIIIVSEELLDFAYSICSLIAICFPITPELPLTLDRLFPSQEALLELINKNRLRERFFYILFGYFNNLRYDANKLINNETVTLTEKMVISFLTFVIGHEYCHFLLGHTRNMEKANAEFDDVIYTERSMENELEADLFATMITDVSMRKKKCVYPISIFGIEICLICIDIISRIECLLGNTDTTHPNYIIRKNNLKRLLVQRDFDYFGSIGFIFAYLTEDMENRYTQLISEVKDDYSDKKIKDCIHKICV